MISSDSTACSHQARRARARLPLLAAAALAVAVPLATGCATDPAPDEGPTGEVIISLTQPGPHGEIYQLTNATFDITSLNTGVVTTVNGNGPALSVSLPPGLVLIELRDGWSLEKSIDGGVTFQKVSALLGSINPGNVRILANQPAFVRFDFLIRETNGMLQISLGVIPDPRELAGGIIVQTASDGLASYALPGNTNMDFAVFFQLSSLESLTLDDGTKEHIYTAFSQGGSFGPIPQPPGAVAGEFYNDRIGTLAGPVAADLTGGFLTYTVAARPDGTITVSGSLIGGFTDLEFAPDAIDAVLPSIGPDGFPNDVFFYDSEAPFNMLTEFGTATGILRIRHLVPSP